MCGIVGYVGARHAAPVLLDGLSRLEYRGYDSAGIAVVGAEGRFSLVRRKGRVAALESARALAGNCGIGHTRWATHGAPSERNAHPHRYQNVCLVHNGILENAASLKEACLARGERFSSDTDSEVAVHLIARFLQEEGELLRAVARATALLSGSYAFAVLCEGREEIVCARRRSPLLVAAGEGEAFAASDAAAFPGAGRRAYALEDGEFARLTRAGVEVFDAHLQRAERAFFPLPEEGASSQKGAFRHFMRKEIAEVPMAAQRSLSAARKMANSQLCEVLCQTKYLHIVACGTAYHSGLCMKVAAESLARVPTEVFLASEYRYADPIVPAGGLTIAVSQSGETADTLAAAELAKERGSTLLALTNVEHSSLSRLADVCLFTRAGQEIAVAATKSFSAQLAALYALVVRLAEARGRGAPRLRNVAALCRAAIGAGEGTRAWAPSFTGARSVFFLGRGADRCAALEGSLKLKEVSYLPGEGYAAGELKHGTLALVDEGTPVVALVCDRALADKTMNAVHEVYARGAPVFLVTPFAELARAKEVRGSVLLPACAPVFSPLVSVIPLQLLAYHVAVAMGRDPDKPRNLAKSVTVE